MRANIIALALASLAALASWLTLGLQAVVDGDTGARLGVLPAWWLLVVLWAAFAGIVWWRRLTPARLSPLILTALACLPWLPGPVPPAFLIWYGPLATAVWVFVVMGLAGPDIRRVWQARAFHDPVRAPWLLGVIALVLSLAGAWALHARLPGGDEPHYLIITQSLLSDGDLQIENNHARGDYFRYHADALKPDYLQRGRNGAIYSIHAPGVSALVAPAFALAGWPGAAAIMSLLAAFAAMLVWLIAWRVTSKDATAAWVAVRPGSAAYHVPDLSAVFVGDALTTGHVLTGVIGPQPAPFTQDPAAADASLDKLASLDATWVLPGHGPPWDGGTAEVVRRVRAFATASA